MFNGFPMSPRRVSPHLAPAVRAELGRASLEFGIEVRDARLRRGWTVRELAGRAGLSPEMVYRVEAGQPASSQTASRLAVALGRRVGLHLVDQRRAATPSGLAVDLVHSKMGEFEAGHLRRTGVRVGIDEPYQHYQFAGRADVVAWDVERRALLHIENRTRFPDLQEVAGAFNAKRAYLGDALAERCGVGRWASETHVMAALWSSEILHALRLRTESFRSLCPDGSAAMTAWWAGDPPGSGTISTLVVLDPLAGGRERPFVGLEAALRARPRYRGYADAVAQLDRAA
jgi:transcriptional regulator with XRE-family HTH domain